MMQECQPLEASCRNLKVLIYFCWNYMLLQTIFTKVKLERDSRGLTFSLYLRKNGVERTVSGRYIWWNFICKHQQNFSLSCLYRNSRYLIALLSLDLMDHVYINTFNL